ncbi:MAG: pyridoxamine 5'-phosphate oxidase [Acidiferrobacterales bacterium]|jgi:pyridoxamine 5'-phosphate oxidase|nr:pyridoxamine 5'-phosphate oxidase [Acidiferrobacterales bacterium]
MKTDVSQLRQQYMAEGLSRDALDPDPVRQFAQWYEQLHQADIFEPSAMTVATVSPDGQPYLRTVLLKLFDESGFVFYTNYGSRKAKHIETNPRVGLLFAWVPLARQVKITGIAEKVPTAESLKYFATRPRGSQIGAWASAQSEIVSSRSMLEAKFEELKQKFSQGEVPLPEFWGGYRVVPQSIEFWQGRDNRLHDRFIYTRKESGDWQIARLAP